MHNLTCGVNEFNLPELSFDTYNKRKSLLHFDLTKSNIFKDDNNDIAIIDFDDSKYGSAVYDISILISFFFFSKSHGIDIDGMRRFIDDYYGDDIKLKNDEVPFIKSCALQWIEYLLNNNKLDPSLIDSFKAKRKLLIEGL
jgi:Ser/Thr protein kinase RdoA (MazF antagonist)